MRGGWGMRNLKRSIGTVTLVLSLATNLARSQAGNLVLRQVADIPMPGPAVRFDYQSLDADNGRPYIAHMKC
jgi:hypothetical protein